MNRFTILIFIIMLGIGKAAGQAPGEDREMRQWMKDIREYKHDFIAKKLDMSREQQNKFFPLYDKMDDEILKINTETRMLERKTYETPEESVTDLEYDMAIQAIYELKSKESAIENQYLEQFKEILTKRQLFLLKGAEKSFSMQMMRRHHQIKDKNKKQ